jgi:NTP pyrophosphatase (non-canonical NTP hydrolase)
MKERDWTKVRPDSLAKWQEMFKEIYGEKDKRDYIPTDLLLHVEEEAAKIDEALRKEKNEEILVPLARLFCWFLSFCTSIGVDLEEAVFDKYQGICPYCGREENCLCITEEKKPSQWFRNPSAAVPATLDEWQIFFEKIYGRINKMNWQIQVWLHFHEELGESSRALRLKEKTKEEIADSFAWLIAFCNKQNIKLAKLVYGVYPGKCDRCGKERCQCPKV